ncbi:hypothetical protein ACI0YO_002040 [Cronobacter sakazakii]
MNTAKLKAAAERVVETYGDEWFEAGRQICTVHKSKIYLISRSTPANILELIAALEAAEKRNAELEANQITATGTQILSEAIGAHAYIAGCLVQGRPDLALEEAQKWVSVFSGVAAGINLETGGGREA